jgi:hypothetical protein
MTDLFISYNSHDEVWAKRLFFDLTTRYPTIKPFWARNAGAIPLGEPFRPIFQGAAKNATHFLVLWSAAAKNSNEVVPELESYLQNSVNIPKSATGATRRLFYVPLESKIDYGSLTVLQGIPDFQGVYDPAKPDRGLGGLEAKPASDNWSRMIRLIGDTVIADQATQRVTLALLVMVTKTVGQIDQVLNETLFGGPTLNKFLQSIGLTVEQAKARYGDTAFSWRPFGTEKTIIDLMEDVREMANRRLGATYRFHWRPIDFVEEIKTATGWDASKRWIDSLSEGPSVVVTDPISLFNPGVSAVFKSLLEYAKRRQSIILSISPNELLAAEFLYGSLLRNSTPMLDTYLDPQVPGPDNFAFCGLNAQATWDIERLIRTGLGYYYFRRNSAAEQPLASGV